MRVRLELHINVEPLSLESLDVTSITDDDNDVNEDVTIFDDDCGSVPSPALSTVPLGNFVVEDACLADTRLTVGSLLGLIEAVGCDFVREDKKSSSSSSNKDGRRLLITPTLEAPTDDCGSLNKSPLA